MANVVIVLDRDPVRRERFLAAARRDIAPFPGLVVDSREGPGWGVLWAAGPRAPGSVLTDGRDGTFVWGDAIDGDGIRLDAAGVRRMWKADGMASFDGFHLAADLTAEGDLRIVSDLMGLLPVHHWTGPDVVLAGTSVEAFHAHPSFRARLDPEGLVGVLLLNGLVGGRTLWSGVRRLGVRCRLQVRDGRCREVTDPVTPAPDRALLGLPLEGQVEIADQALRRAMRRQVGVGEELGILLSGGLDSRQLAAYALEEGAAPKALTFGLDTDIEMRCAKEVAKALGIAHAAVEIPAREYGEAARRLARCEGLAAGFSNVLDWAMVPHLEQLPPRVLLGHVFDGVVGGIHIPWALDPGAARYDFANIFRRFNAWGFAPGRLRELLPPEHRDLVASVVEDARKLHEGSSDQPHLQAWHFDLQTRQRFHVGAAVWPASFRSWPVSPVFDREVFDLAASLPASALAGRRLQRELLVRIHPRLARVPLDRNSLDSLPLEPTLADRLRGGLSSRVRRWTSRIPGSGGRRENRFYYRTYAFGSPGWETVRALAEVDRGSLPELLDPEGVRSLVPAPGRNLDTGDGIVDSSVAKLLTGLAMVCSRFGLR